MFVEEGFRVRFGNGEVIDFYADSRVEKEGWMNVLGETVGKGYSAGNGQVRPWTELVLRTERSLKNKLSAEDRPLGKRPYNPPPPPKDQQPTQGSRPALPAKHQHRLSQPNIAQQGARHQKTRSVMF